MQSEDYPYISITLTQINLKENLFEVQAIIKIAHQTKSYSFNILPQQDNNYRGYLKLNINDFDMEAPRKLLGTIQVDPIINY
ncbi:hypothetical protein [Psychroflexus sp. ALD_RP9]|uniref:hypothetical protein n=1 Tax=Psychroflexus sp. ALD_RP9 TaxID=2777186 RepID=UPI001A8CBB50|nr:hypothetical protein [Psychroflexus sp. ALD_RP9]QSS98244.1 hypothetical protein IMZ30_05870 [Psychroflexus sp. ALD_RP9]